VVACLRGCYPHLTTTTCTPPCIDLTLLLLLWLLWRGYMGMQTPSTWASAGGEGGGGRVKGAAGEGMKGAVASPPQLLFGSVQQPNQKLFHPVQAPPHVAPLILPSISQGSPTPFPSFLFFLFFSSPFSSSPFPVFPLSSLLFPPP